MRKFALTLTLTAAVAALAAARPAQAQNYSTGDIVDLAVENGNFKTLVAAVQAAGLVDALKADGPLTVFAPTDDAFAALPDGTVESLLKPENKDRLVSILTYHVASGKAMAADALQAGDITTLNGQRVNATLEAGQVMIGNARVVANDIEASNGVIHVIDRVILPNDNDILGTAVEAGQFETLATAIGAAGLVDALSGEGPFTVFAPTDEAFAALPAGTVKSLLKPENREKLTAILTYHVVQGRAYSDAAASGLSVATLEGGTLDTAIRNGRLQAGEANVIAADIETANGVIHVIDKVLMPPASGASRGEAREASPAHAARMIEHAINRGAPMYNAGDPHGCTVVYQQAAVKLMKMSQTTVTTDHRRHLTTALAKAHHAGDARQQAWIMRHALDAVYADLQQM